MEAFQNKNEFMQALREELAKRNISDTRDILLDFEQHFADGISTGLTEAEVCGKLGDLGEIVSQYQDEAAEMNSCRAVEPIAAATSENAAASHTTENKQADNGGFSANDYGAAQSTAQGAGYGAVQGTAQGAGYGTAQQGGTGTAVNVGGLIGAVCVDVFVLSWALPALIGVICAFFSIPIAFGVTGLASLFCGFFGQLSNVISFVSPFGAMSNIFFGLMLMALSGLGVLLSIVIVKGFIGIIINIINWHSRLIVGRNVINDFGGKRTQAQGGK